MSELNTKVTQEIEALEKELMRDQVIEVGIYGENNELQKTVDKFATKVSLYDNPLMLQKMLDESKAVMQAFVKTAGNRGKMLGKSEMERFLSDSERIDRKQKTLRIIRQANERQASRRLDFYVAQLEKEGQILKSDINIFFKQTRLAGFSKKESLAQLVRAASDRDGLAQGYAKRLKSITVAATRREKQAAHLEAFKEFAKPNVLWQWIAVSVKPCPDCQPRAGKVFTLERWQKLGVPGSGRTICGPFCRCRLFPLSIAEDQFPDVKTFRFDTDNLVLTTASEERALKSKASQPPQKEK